MPTGYLCLVLHGHLPFVYHPEQTGVLEERWFFEGLTECYLPLLGVFTTLKSDQVDFRITLSLSPTLITMLTDELLQERYIGHLQKSITLARLERERLSADPHFKHLAGFYLDKLLEIKDMYERYERNLINPLKQLQQQGYLEIITTCATHGYLPLMMNRASQRAQIKTALDLYDRHFDRPPAGIWLPECGYAPGLDEILKEYGISYFFVDTHGIINSRPAPVYGIFAPVCTGAGVAAFGRDPESSRQVWDRQGGYPGDPYYREFYRDIGYDLDIDYIGPFLPGGHLRVDTGFKYHRITGNGLRKEPYLPGAARERAARHATDFCRRRLAQLERAARVINRRPLAVAPYDAELFGHWWFEGPWWLNYLCREVAATEFLAMVTPTEYLQEYPENQVADLTMCSWGAGGYNEYWLNPSNDWIYKHLHRAEDKMSALADEYPQAGEPEKRCLNQAARELLLAQSSDWPFIIHSGTAVDYAVRRFKNHIGRFNILADMLASHSIHEGTLHDIESRSKFLPDIDYRIYRSSGPAKRPACARSSYRILMLSWEYPPKTVGGLARHVHDLSCALAAAGDEVHVITCPAAGSNIFSLDRGVYVHRVRRELLTAENFMEWVNQLNNGMIQAADHLVEVFGSFDLVHAHDWLVGAAAREISDRLRLPLVATIHATEHGRNRGLHNDLQRHIHSLETELARHATMIIGCSGYMGREIARLFNQPADKLRVIPNGVEVESILSTSNKPASGGDSDRNIVFLGRLVPEKGVQVLIAALPQILQTVGPVKLLIAGKGPYQPELESLADRLGVAGQVHFLGFVNDDARNRLLCEATVAVFPSLYEPFGIVALEAMAAGVPLVVSDTGGLRDVIEHGVDGYLAPPGDAHMLARYVSELIKNPELAQHFARRARRNVVTKFDWRQIASATLEVYAEAINRT
jgi:1,4-alpha-glucan branching enzyme